MRLVIEENNWLELRKDENITVNGNLRPAGSLTYDDMGSVITNVPQDRFTKGSPVEGRLTNLASFED